METVWVWIMHHNPHSKGIEMPVYFANPGEIDLDVIRIMGVSIKESDSPIGYFGTGLKFAIATLLRTGHSIRLSVGGKTYDFSERATEIRGKSVDRVYMNEEPLSFTTSLGRNWEVWQAYRELHSNTLDEGGKISNRRIYADTIIEVDGPTIGKEYADRGRIFLEREPLSGNGRLEVYSGRSPFVYYRGVRAGRLPSEALFTYNILADCELSEDRNFKDLWDVEYKVETNLPNIPNLEIAEAVIADTSAWDGALNFSYCGSPSVEFLAAAEAHASNAEANKSAHKLLSRHRQLSGTFPPCEIDGRMTGILTEAISIIGPLGCTVEIDDVTVCASLGPNTHGLYLAANFDMSSPPAI